MWCCRLPAAILYPGHDPPNPSFQWVLVVLAVGCRNINPQRPFQHDHCKPGMFTCQNWHILETINFFNYAIAEHFDMPIKPNFGRNYYGAQILPKELMNVIQCSEASKDQSLVSFATCTLAATCCGRRPACTALFPGLLHLQFLIVYSVQNTVSNQKKLLGLGTRLCISY